MLAKKYILAKVRIREAIHSLRAKKDGGLSYVELALLIITILIIAALVLAFLYSLFNGTILPNVKTKITDLFNYNG